MKKLIWLFIALMVLGYITAPPVIPSGLVLPNGMTVQEFIDSGQTPYGKLR